MPPVPSVKLPPLPASALDQLLDRSGGLVYTVGAGGELRSVNRAMRERLDLDGVELPDLRSLLRMLYPEPAMRETVQSAHDKALGGEKGREAEWLLTSRTGDTRQVRWQLTVFGSGEERLLVVQGEDVTDRRKLESWVRLQNAMLEAVPEAVIYADVQGRILHWSAGAERLLGYSPRAALERPLSNLLVGDDPRGISLEWIRRAGQEASFELVQALRRERGDSVECEVKVSRVQGDRSAIAGLAIIAQPVTVRVAAPVRLPAAEPVRELDRAVAALIAVPAVVAAPDGSVRAWSRGAERLAGMGAARAKGRRVLDEVMVVPQLGWDGLLSRLAGRGKHAATVEVHRANGSTTQAELDAVALRAPDGAIDAVLLLFVDRLETEAVIAESRRTKERALESVLLEGLVRRLLDAFAHFEPDHRVVLARLSDLRSLARMVNGGVPLRDFDQFTRRGRFNDLERDLDDVMDRLGDGVSRLRTLAQDVSRFASTEPDAPMPVRISRELEAARDLVGHAFENRLEVEFVVEDLPAARAARGPLLRGFCLLLLAALESFPSEGGGRVQVEGRHQGGWIVLEVRDNGAGYSAEVQTRIGDLDFLGAQSGFAPLFLGMAREAIRAAGGSLELGSATGTGARIKVSFPVAEQPGPIRPLDAARPAMPTRGHVLLVEEDELLRLSVERHLAESFEVTALGTLADAISRLRDSTFQVAVLSFPRPESFGLRLLTRFAEEAPDLGRNVVVVVPPGLKAATRDRLVALGTIVITRPVDFTTLRSVCERLLPGELMAIGEELAEVEEDSET